MSATVPGHARSMLIRRRTRTRPGISCVTDAVMLQAHLVYPTCCRAGRCQCEPTTGSRRYQHSCGWCKALPDGQAAMNPLGQLVPHGLHAYTNINGCHSFHTRPSAGQVGVHACLLRRGVLAAACALHEHGCTFLCGAAAVCIVNCCIGQCQHGRQGCLIGHPQASWWPSDDPAGHNAACGKLAMPPCRVSCTLAMQT